MSLDSEDESAQSLLARRPVMRRRLRTFLPCYKPMDIYHAARTHLIHGMCLFVLLLTAFCISAGV